MRSSLNTVLLFAAGASAWFNWTAAVLPDQPDYAPNGYQLTTDGPTANSTYDYIIVGSGPGGSPLAARLAQAGYSVLLLEAGGDHAAERQVEVPALHPFASDYTPISWDFFVDHYSNNTQAKRDSKMTYLTPAGEYYSGLEPPEGSEQLGVRYPRTGALGGCAVHNALITMTPTDSDWQYIANITGDSSWEADNMRKYYEQIEKCRYLPSTVVGHGFSGWLETKLTPVILIAEDLKVASLVVAAATAMAGKAAGLVSSLVSTVTGLGEVLLNDINTPSSTRDTVDEIYQIPLSMNDDYVRSSPRDLIISVLNETNSDGSKKYKLDVALNTLVTKVNFDTTADTPKATGVSYLHGESLYRADPRASKSETTGGVSGQVFASKEVIVSGGTFNTPQILKLSGVGPKEELESFDIPVVKDLPGVGGNMQDRYEMGIVGKAPSDFSLLEKCTFLQGDDPCYDDWKDNVGGATKGGYTTNGIAFGYLHHSSVAEADPDLFLGGVPAYFNGYFPSYSVHATNDLSIWTFLTLKAHSRNNAGSVNLTSADPLDTPKIRFHSLLEGVGGEEDLQAVYEGMKYGIQAFESVIPLDGAFERVWPPPEISTEAELKQFAMDEAWGHHASCTCPIGADDDVLAVLDGDFRVRGVDGLRVVDASIFPKIPGMYVALPIYMASEKAADVIIAADTSS